MSQPLSLIFFQRKVLSVQDSLSPSCMHSDDFYYSRFSSSLCMSSFKDVTVSEALRASACNPVLAVYFMSNYQSWASANFC